MKRGRPKGATAYPETAVCIKCGVFRPKRRGFCDRCRPRNRGSAAKTAPNSTTTACALRPSSTATTTATVNGDEWQKGSVLVSKSQPIAAGQSPASDLIAGDLHRSSPSPSPPSSWGSTNKQGVKRRVAQGDATSPQLREKRRRTVSAPATGTSGGMGQHNILPTPILNERNRNVDVVSALTNASGSGKDRKMDAETFFPFSSSVSTGARQLALLLPRSDGTAVDVVPIQFLASPTASTSSAASSPHPSHTSPPPSLSSAHPLMSLANASVLAASRSTPSPPLSLATASPSHSWSSPASSPTHMQLSSSPFSSPSSSFTCGSSSTNSSFSFALPPAPPVKDKSTGACGSKAGDLILPSLYSLHLPRPALPNHAFPMQSSTLPLASMLAPTAPLHFAHN